MQVEVVTALTLFRVSISPTQVLCIRRSSGAVGRMIATSKQHGTSDAQGPIISELGERAYYLSHSSASILSSR